MSKDKLESAKKILGHIKGYDIYEGNDHIEILEWLIEQVERVKDLEEIIYKDERQAVLEGLYEENRRYREAFKKMEEIGIQGMLAELEELEDEE